MSTIAFVGDHTTTTTLAVAAAWATEPKPLVVEVDRDHRLAARREVLGGRPADPGPRPGHDRHPSSARHGTIPPVSRHPPAD